MTLLASCQVVVMCPVTGHLLLSAVIGQLDWYRLQTPA